MILKWAQFKSFIDTKSLPLKCATTAEEYLLFAGDGALLVESKIDRLPTDTTDLADFENNYLQQANKPDKGRVIINLGNDDYSINPVGFHFSATKNVESKHDLLLTKAYAIKGGSLFMKNQAWGDCVAAQIIDKDNALGYGGTEESPTVVSRYIEKWCVMPGVENRVENISIGKLPVSGLYFRLIYISHESATQDAEGLVNLMAYIES